MDIVTHTMMGAIMAAPLAERHPLAAAFLVAGSILPDVDVLSAALGRTKMMRYHQTYTHSFPAIALCALGLWFGLSSLDVPDAMRPELTLAALALALGMSVHVLTDWTNTFGVTLFAPFRTRRRCGEWVFFIDATIVTTNTLALLALAWAWTSQRADLMLPISAAQTSWLVAYFIGRGALRAHAGRRAPEGTLSLVPSALWPHRYLGCRLVADEVELFEWNALTSRVVGDTRRVPSLVERWGATLANVTEYTLMRELSEAYVPVSDEGGVVVCKDLRTRNFATDFGQLDLKVEPNGTLSVERWNV